MLTLVFPFADPVIIVVALSSKRLRYFYPLLHMPSVPYTAVSGYPHAQQRALTETLVVALSTLRFQQSLLTVNTVPKISQ